MPRWLKGEGWIERRCARCGVSLRAPRHRLRLWPASCCSVACANANRKGEKRPTFSSDEELTRLYTADGLTLSQIASRFGVTLQAVAWRLQAAGVARRKGGGGGFRDAQHRERAMARLPRGAAHPQFHDLPVEQIAAAYAAGESTTTLGRRYGVSPVTIQRKLRAAGVTLRQRGFSRWRTARDGHVVQSGWELLVDDWLTDHGIAHEVQPTLPFGKSGRVHQNADFRTGDYFIEVWGVVHNAAYAQRRIAKTEHYRLHGLRLLELWPRHIEREDCAPLHVLLT